MRYCIDRSRPDLPTTPNEPVVYYFHGINADETHWARSLYPQTLAEMVHTNSSVPAFTIVSFQTSKMSYFTDHKKLETGRNAYESWFLVEFLPWIEHHYPVCHEAKCRGTIGHSMGGWGALKTALRHPELFSFTGANSAAILPYNIFAPMNLWWPYLDRHPIGRVQGGYLIFDARRAFVDGDYYDQHSVPTLLRNWSDPQNLPALYFDCGGKDHYGFDEGFKILRDQLSKTNFSAETHFYPDGTHAIENEPLQRKNLLIWVSKQVSSLQNKKPRRH